MVTVCDDADVLSDEVAKEGGEGTVEEGRSMVHMGRKYRLRVRK